jgi:hypothetical protein
VENTLEHVGIGNNFLNRTPTAQQQREKDWQMRQHETKKLHSKENGHQMKDSAHRIGENLCQVYIWQETNNQNI